MSTLLARTFVIQRYGLQFWPIKKPFIFALLTISFATGALAQPQISSQPLSLEKALHIAEQRSQAVLAQEALARSSQEMAVRAKELPDPVLQLSLNNLPVNGAMAYSLTEDFMTMRSLGISQTFTGENKRQARANVFERKVHTAWIAKELTISQLRRETALAWFDRFYQQQMLVLLEEQQKETKLQVNATEASYRAGRGRQSDIFLARTTVAEIQDRILQAQALIKNATTTLARWIGDTTYSSLVLPPDITHSPIDKVHLTHQINEHPDIAVIVAQEAEARAEVESARQEKQADWTWSLMYSERSSTFSDMVSIGVSVPLQWDQKNRQDRVVASELAKADQLRAEREEMTREHLAETQRWLDTWSSNLTRLSDYQEYLIPLASQRTQATLAQYRGGNGELSEVLDARKTEIVTRIERLRIEMETAAIWVALEYLASHDTSEEYNATSQQSRLLESK